MDLYKLYRCLLLVSILSCVVLGTLYLSIIRHQRRYMLRDISQTLPPKHLMAVSNKLEQNAAESPRTPLPSCPHVLIFTHPRSGSTMTGQIIQEAYDSFYAFEPLRFLGEFLDNGRNIVFLNNTKRLYSKRDRVWLEADILYRWYTCDFNRIDLVDLTSSFFGTYSTNLQEYASCIKNGRPGNAAKSVRVCLSLIHGPCTKAKVRTVKTVRLSIESLHLLLEWMPHLRVIYLIRDPRGRLASQMTLTPANWEIVTFTAKDMCDVIVNEILVILNLKEKYSKRLKILMYERFAADPIRLSKRLFEFLTLKYTTAMKVIVKRVTRSGVDKTGCYWCTKNTHSDITANRWRQSILFDHVKEVDKQCLRVYALTGYKIFKNVSTLRNMHIPLYYHNYTDRPITDVFL